jgi:hypothetical protein
MLHTYGVAPPEPDRFAEYAVPTMPFGNDVVLIISGAVTVNVKLRVAEEAPSVTETVNVAVAAPLAAPEIMPA